MDTIISFNIIAHDYLITEQSINELYINIAREMRRTPFIGMKQPAPSDGFMGMDTVLTATYRGQPARSLQWKLWKDHCLIQEGTTNHNGMSFGLDVEFSNGLCRCRPQWFRKWYETNRGQCDVPLPAYQIEFELPAELTKSTETASPVLSVGFGYEPSTSEPHADKN